MLYNTSEFAIEFHPSVWKRVTFQHGDSDFTQFLFGVKRRVCSKPSFLLHLWPWKVKKSGKKNNQQKLRVCSALSKRTVCKASVALLFCNNCFWKDCNLLTCKHWWSPRVHPHEDTIKSDSTDKEVSAAQVVAPPLKKDCCVIYETALLLLPFSAKH